MPPDARVLVVDDHAEMVRLLTDALGDAGYQVVGCGGGAEAIAALGKGTFDAVLTDLRMADADGLDVLAAAHGQDPSLPVLIMTAFGGVEGAVEAIKRGAFHYFTKPFRLDEVRLFVDRAVEHRRLQVRHRNLVHAAHAGAAAKLIGRSAVMTRLRELIARSAEAAGTVLIRGESGTGKELVARALHFDGPRAGGPFVAVNCTALPAALLESEVFGHARGAFTGATSARRGLFLEANGGTLFLDEIGDMPIELQAKLLRVLEDGAVRPLGSETTHKVNVRVVAATHQELERLVEEQRFRADLFYRLNVIGIDLPPLRDRKEDIPTLAHLFLARALEKNPQARARSLAPDAVEALAARPWPGNVRELENAVERLVVMVDRPQIHAADLPPPARQSPGPAPLEEATREVLSLRELEWRYIAWMVARCGGNKTKAAELLGIDVSTIHRRERERERGNEPR